MKTEVHHVQYFDARDLCRALLRPGALLLLIAGLLLYGGTYLLGTFESPVRADGVGYAMYLPAWVVHHSFGVAAAADDMEAARRLSVVPRTALILGMSFMFIWLGNTGGGAFISFQF